MSIRVHYTDSAQLSVSVFAPGDDIPSVYLDDDPDEERAELRLVIEDAGNCEAIVIDGSKADLNDLALTIAERANAASHR